MTPSLEHIKLLMREIGPVLDEVYAVVETGEDNWIIEFEDTTEIQLEWIESIEKLLLSALLGPIQQGRETVLMPLLLSFNMLVPQTGGARVALSPEDGNVVLMVDLAANQLALSAFSEALRKFVTLASQLEEMVASEHSPASLSDGLPAHLQPLV